MPDDSCPVEVVEVKWETTLARESARRLSLLLFRSGSDEREDAERGEAVHEEGDF